MHHDSFVTKQTYTLKAVHNDYILNTIPFNFFNLSHAPSYNFPPSAI